MTDQTNSNNNMNNNNIGTLSINADLINGKQLTNNDIQINNYNNSEFINSNLNINNLIYLNSNNNNNMDQIQNYSNQNQNSNIEKNDINNQNYSYVMNYNNTHNQNNYHNNSNNNYYRSGNFNIKTAKPYFTLKNQLIKLNSLDEVNEKVYKDLQQIEKILPNYKNYMVNNNFEAVNLCLKYIECTHFFFNEVATKKIGDIFNYIIFSNNQDEKFKYKLKEIFQKMIPYNIRKSYLDGVYSQNYDKNLYNIFKKDINISKNYKENMFYLYEIFEIVSQKLNNKDREELKNIFNKYSYIINNSNINNNKYYNDITNNSNRYRKHSFQSQNNNWNYNAYDNNSYNNISNNNKNYIDDRHSDELSYKKTYDNNNYYSSGFQNRKNNYKGSYSSRHYYNDNNKIKNKGNRKHSAYGGGAMLVEVSTTPKKEDTENDANEIIWNIDVDKKDDEINAIQNDTNNNNDIIEKKEEKIVEINNNNINDDKIENKEEDKKEQKEENENEGYKNKDEIQMDNDQEEKKVENNLLNELNISHEKEEKNEDNNNIENKNSTENGEKKEEHEDNNDNHNTNSIEREEIGEKEEKEINNFDLNLKEDILISDFNSLNPFNEKKVSEKDMSEKEDSSNNLGIIHTNQNLDLNNNEENDNDGSNNLVLNIINNTTENDFNNINLYDNFMSNDNDDLHNEPNENFEYNQINNDMNINIDDANKEKDLIEVNNNNNYNNEINEHENEVEKQIKSDLLNNSPKNEIIFSNSENNINEKINLPKALIDNNISNNNMKNKSISDNNIIKLNKNLLNQININANANMNINANNNFNNNDNIYNISNDQAQMLRYISQNNNNSLYNINNINPFLVQNSQKTNLNNNILNFNNSINMNLLNNLNSGMNMLNLINSVNNTNLMNINGGVYYQNNTQNYYNILFNYLDETHNLLSTIKPYSKNKNNHFNMQSNIDYIKQKSEKLSLDYNNKLKKIKENNPLLYKERLNLFEEKIILPIYSNICSENQQRKEIYTEVYNKYKDIITKILQKNKLDDTKVDPYGSIVNNFMTEYGDIDICVNPKDNNTICDYDTVLEEIKDEIVNNQKIAKYIILEKYSKFLILKLKDIETDIDLDITVQNILPIINTKLIRFYSLYDQRFHIFGIFLKFWVKKNHIHGSLDKYLSSYALLILIIHYLQTITEPKLLPILQQIRNIKKEYKYHNEVKELITNLYFEEDINEIKNYMKIINSGLENENSVVELLIGFFEYYAYKYDHYWISISRSDKIPVDDNEMAAFPLEDPFDINYNPGKSMRLNTLQYTIFVYCMKKELNNILSGEYFKYVAGE